MKSYTMDDFKERMLANLVRTKFNKGTGSWLYISEPVPNVEFKLQISNGDDPEEAVDRFLDWGLIGHEGQEAKVYRGEDRVYVLSQAEADMIEDIMWYKDQTKFT